MNILIAEDDPILRRSLALTLEGWGYAVTAVADGAAALSALRGPDAPNLAVLDWMMPKKTGPEVCREARQSGIDRYIYLVLLTARNQSEDLIKGLEAGADDYLMKPYNPAELRARLNAGRRILDLHAELIAAREEMRRMAQHDALTDLWNRRAILEILDSELARSLREGSPVGLVLVDVDYFKEVNDTLGHQTGDNVLREVARRMGAAVRPYDIVGRYGGEEFLVVLPGCDVAQTRALSERLREQVSAGPVVMGASQVSVTVSLGVAVSGPGQRPNADALLLAADAALYRAKEAGRDRVEVAPDLSAVAS
jgi:diguanylate cyclase (GGDEF)-like protein